METEFDEIDRGPEESEVAVLEGHLTSLEKRGEIPSLQFTKPVNCADAMS